MPTDLPPPPENDEFPVLGWPDRYGCCCGFLVMAGSSWRKPPVLLPPWHSGVVVVQTRIGCG